LDPLVALGIPHQHADPPLPLSLQRHSGERRGEEATRHGTNECPALHYSIT